MRAPVARLAPSSVTRVSRLATVARLALDSLQFVSWVGPPNTPPCAATLLFDAKSVK